VAAALPVLPLAAAAAVWLVLSGGQASSWLVGVPTVVAAVWAGRALRAAHSAEAPAARVRWSALPGFALFFLYESLRGGIDVARRLLHRRPAVAPGFIDYRCALPAGGARLLFANSVSLLPGTLSADLACISHHPTAADADPSTVAGRTPCTRLNVVSATPTSCSGPCTPPQRRLDALASRGDEKRRLEAARLRVHVLDVNARPEHELQRLEARVAALFEDPTEDRW